jgi:hypothetical protein
MGNGRGGGMNREFGGGGSGEYREYGAMNTGERRPNVGGMTAPENLQGAERGFREGLRDLQQLRQQLRSEGAPGTNELTQDVDRLIREMQQIDPSRFPGNPQLIESMRSQVLPALEQLELQLRRQIEKDTAGQVRTGSSGKVPAGYSEAVAEYYRRLSKTKQ